MTSLEIAHISLEEFRENLLPCWLGETLPELFREYLSISPAVRTNLLSKHFFNLFECDEADVLVCKQGQRYLGVMGVEYLDWDSRHFGVNCGKISPCCLRSGLTRNNQEAVHKVMLEHGIEWARKKNIKLLQRRLLSSRLCEINALEDMNFHLVDNVVTLAAAVKNVLLATKGKERSDLMFRSPNNSDGEKLISMTRGTFSYSRFLNDKLLSPVLGDDLYVQWASNFFEKVVSCHGTVSDNCGILVAQLKDQIVGYVAYQVDHTAYAMDCESLASIDLIVVDPKFQGEGMGQSLFRAVAKVVNDMDVDFLESTTWINHGVSMASNQKAGLRVCENLFTYHCYL